MFILHLVANLDPASICGKKPKTPKYSFSFLLHSYKQKIPMNQYQRPVNTLLAL